MDRRILSKSVLAALVGVLAACSNGGPGEPVEEPAHIQTGASFLSLNDALTQWWAEPGKERIFVFDIVNTGRAWEAVFKVVMECGAAKVRKEFFCRTLPQ